MARTSKFRIIFTNILLALVFSLIVNFSYLLILFGNNQSEESWRPKQKNGKERVIEAMEIPSIGTLNVAADGYGYIVYKEPYNGIDSVYVPSYQISRMRLNHLDNITVWVTPPRRNREGAHFVMSKLSTVNGVEFDYSTLYGSSDNALETVIQIFTYALLAFILLMLMTTHVKQGKRGRSFISYLLIYSVSIAIVVGFYFLQPFISLRPQHPGSDIFNILRCAFVFVCALLYGRIYDLIYQRQVIRLENERLENENLTTRYNMLVSQINPHFFFNSLNSLSMLVREKHDEKALKYIDQLSYTFRYIIQNGQNTITTLSDEMKFVEAYAYLFQIRYEDKLFFDIDINPEYNSWQLPALTLQPLIENAVKHNTISKNNPLHVSIRTEGGRLVVSNPVIPKLTKEPSTGIGLQNMQSRWQLINSSAKIDIKSTEAEFTVTLPLMKPAK